MRVCLTLAGSTLNKEKIDKKVLENSSTVDFVDYLVVPRLTHKPSWAGTILSPHFRYEQLFFKNNGL